MRPSDASPAACDCEVSRTLDTEQVPLRIPRDVLWRDVEGEILVLDLRTERYYGLDAVGADVWRLLAADLGTHATEKSLSAALHEVYDVPLDRLHQDVRTLLHSLASAGLLEPPPVDEG